jgi:hypothetical protein
MDASFWTISGWAIALISLVINYLQLQKNNDLKVKVNLKNESLEGNAKAKQQYSAGNGDNYMAGKGIKVNKKS